MTVTSTMPSCPQAVSAVRTRLRATPEQAYEFLGEVIEAVNDAETHTAFLQTLDALVVEWRDVPRPHGSLAGSNP
ncbi:hypothetical protein [Streptomyces sp. NPDC058086]|uniref:hypothetical protein n=1 Tax=Streptomyces sp. NPDC058086 TaxID=3346334 RepID=UPI0036EEFDB1